MAFTDTLLPIPFYAVFGMHRLEDFLLSEFSSLSTIKSHSDLQYYTNTKIDRFTFNLTLFKPQVSDFFPVEVKKAGAPSHSFGRAITSTIPWILVDVVFSPSLPSTC